MKAAVEEVEAEEPRTAAPQPVTQDGPMTTRAIHIPKATLSLLRRVAVARADDRGGRPSVSAVLGPVDKVA